MIPDWKRQALRVEADCRGLWPDPEDRDLSLFYRLKRQPNDPFHAFALCGLEGQPGPVLELGAGVGVTGVALARALSERGAPTRVIVSDSHAGLWGGVAAMRTFLREYRPRGAELDRLEFLAASFDALPFPDGRIGGAVCQDCLHHAENLDAALTEIARVLAVGGILVAREPVVGSACDMREALGECADEPGEKAYTLRRWLDAFASAGLAVEIVEHARPFDEETGGLGDPEKGWRAGAYVPTFFRCRKQGGRS